MTLVQRLLQKILVAVTWRPGLTIILAFALAGFSISYTVRNLGFQTSQSDLISPKHRLVQLARNVDQFNSLDGFVVAIENTNTTRSLNFLKALVHKLQKDHEHFAELYYRIDPDTLRKWVLLYPDKKDLLSLRDNLEEHQDFIRDLSKSPNLSNFYGLLNNEIASAMVGELFTGFLNDDKGKDEDKPFDLTFLINSLQSMNTFLEGENFKSPWGSLFSDESWNEDTEGYFWTDNKDYLMLFVTPVETGGGFNKAQESLTTLRNAVAEVRAEFPGVQAGVTGQDALNMDEMTSSFRDMSVATIISLVGLTLLLTLFWRGLRRPLFEMTELVIALSLTFGLTTLVVGHLNILSIVFAPLLLGLGIDYGIHWLARYQEEEKGSSASRKEAIQTTMVKLGPGIILAGFTAALSFFPLVLTGFKGLVELGIISSMGMVMTTFTTLFVLPALTLMFDKPATKPLFARKNGDPLFPVTDRRAIVILGVSCVGLIMSLFVAKGVTFDLNMLNLQSKDAESVVWEKKMLEDSKRSSMFGAVFANSLEEVKEKSRRLEELPTVSKVQSIETVLPQDQRAKIEILSQLKPFLPDPALFMATGDHVDVADLEKTLSRIRFKMLDSSKTEWGNRTPLENQMIHVRQLISSIRQNFNTMDESKLQSRLQDYDSQLMSDLNDKLDLLQANANTSPMQLSDLPKEVQERFVGKNGTYLIRVFPAVDIWEPEYLGRFVDEITSVDPDAVGDPVTLYVFTRAFRDACIKASIYAVIFISVLLLFTLRSLPKMLMAMIPLLFGTVWTIGLMRFFDVNLNLANSLFLPLIVGAGVEYGIIIMQRRAQQGVGGVELPFSTGKGIILAGLTTTVGFGSLTIASHQGIHSLGVLATIGSLSVVAAAVVLLPAVLRLETIYCRRLASKSVDVPVDGIKEKCVTLKEEQI